MKVPSWNMLEHTLYILIALGIISVSQRFSNTPCLSTNELTTFYQVLRPSQFQGSKSREALGKKKTPAAS